MSRRALAVGLLATAAVSVLAVAVDMGGPFRALITTLFVLLGPGLALSLPMGPMAPEARVLVAIAGSVATATLVSLLLLLVGAWSGELGVSLLAMVVVLLAGFELRRDPRHPGPEGNGMSADPTIPAADHWT